MESAPIDFLSDHLWLVLAISIMLEGICWGFDPIVAKRHRQAEAKGATPHQGWRSSPQATTVRVRKWRLVSFVVIWAIGATLWLLTDASPESRPMREAIAGAILLGQFMEVLSWWRAYVEYGALIRGAGEGRFRWLPAASPSLWTAGSIRRTILYLTLWLLLDRTFFLGAAVLDLIFIPIGLFVSFVLRHTPPSSESPAEDSA